MYINLGIGIPTLVPIFINPQYRVVMQGENGMLGLNGYPEEGMEDPDLIDPAKQTVKADIDASYFSSSESFAMIRGGHLDWTLLGAMEVNQKGDLANWIIPGKMVKGMGGAMDLVGSGSQVMVLMEHAVKGKSKILQECTLPLTGKGCVKKIVTELAVFDFENNSMILREIAEGHKVDDIYKLTDAKFELDSHWKYFQLIQYNNGSKYLPGQFHHGCRNSRKFPSYFYQLSKGLSLSIKTIDQFPLQSFKKIESDY